jgi:ADP-heptose:LPS heptosyltransferase
LRAVTDVYRAICPTVIDVCKWAGIARLGGIGDNLIAASVLRPLKKQGYKIEFIAQHPHHEVLLNNPFIDKLTVKQNGDIPSGDDWQKWFVARGKEYDRFVNLSHSCEGLLAPFYAMTSWHWPAEFRRKQFGRNYLEVVHDIVGVEYDFGPLFFPTADEKRKALETKRKLAIGDRPLIGWIIRGTRIDKLYPQAPTTIARLIKELDAAVITFGAPRPAPDMDLAYQIQEHVIAQNGSSTNFSRRSRTRNAAASGLFAGRSPWRSNVI